MSDVRARDRRGGWFVDRIVATHSLVLKTVGGDRAGEAAMNRYLGHEDIDPNAILAPHVARTQAAAQGRRIVVAQARPRSTLPGAPAAARTSDPAVTAPAPASSSIP